MKIRHWLVGTVLLLMSVVTAAADDWRIFGVHGTVEILSGGGSVIAVSKEKSLMMKVPDGSTVNVKGKGKLVLVSLKSRQAFEVGDNTTAIVDTDTIRSVRGSVRPRSGFAPPAGKDGKMGGIVMRGAGKRGCLSVVAPVNTKVPSLMPELVWDNRCSGKVNLTILSSGKVIHSAAAVYGASYIVPANLLQEGARYLWVIDDAASFDVSSGVFVVADSNENSELMQRTQEAKLAANLEDRFAYIFFLADRGFLEMARKELGKLRAEFPESPNLAELL